MRALLVPLALAVGVLALAPARAAGNAAAAERPRNLFAEYLGKTDAEVRARVDGAWRQLLAGDPETERLYYPLGADAAYVPDINNRDVRTEGLSYAMMICVQLDQREEFDRIWRFARRHMRHDAGPFRGYFAWHTDYEGRQLSPGPAPDGEEWFVMALFFAGHRWGGGYGAEAQELLRVMLHKHEQADRGNVTDMFDREHAQVVFVPTPPGSTFTDPSYHLPAFTALWAKWAADPADREFLGRVTRTSREFFRRAAHPRTGLMPDYAHFDGRPYARNGHEDFRYDAWRTLANPALDWAWWGADPWQVEQSNRVLAFLASHGDRVPDLFTVDGRPLSADVNAPGLIAMAAVAALAADRPVGEPWVRRLWELETPRGHYRYYNGLLTMLALLQVSGQFRIYGPVAP